MSCGRNVVSLANQIILIEPRSSVRLRTDGTMDGIRVCALAQFSHQLRNYALQGV